MQTQFRRWRGVLITSFSVAGLVIALRLTGLFQLLELAAFDQLFRFRPLEPADPHIAIVGIDGNDLDQLGWPISDADLAQALRNLKQYQPRAIGMDIYRDLPVEPGHEELVEVFESTPNLIGIQKVVGDDKNEATSFPPVLKRLDQVGANDFPVDVDGKIRRCFLYLDDQDGKVVFSLGFKLAQIYLEAEKVVPQMRGEIQVQLGQAVFSPLAANNGGYIRTNSEGYQILLNYRGPQASFPIVSFSDVLEDRVNPEFVRDRIILIGSTAESLKDRFLTPYSGGLVAIPEPMSGVEVHANITSQIINSALEGRVLLKTWADPLEWIWILIWSFLGTALSWKWYSNQQIAKNSLRTTSLRIALASVVLGGGSYVAFMAGWWIPIIPPLISLVGAAIASTGYILWENLRLSYREIEEYAHTLEIKVEERTQELKEKNGQLEQTLQQLTAAQKQIIAQEKLASLGSLTAGIAHEISNPLNFVNNFANVSVELTQEIVEEIANQSERLDGETIEYITDILSDLKDSVAEINQHGKRAESIIHSMLMHAGDDNGQRQLTDINALLSEATQLAYHGLRAKDSLFNVDIKTIYDDSIGNVEVVPQDISRAFLNIINNAFYAVNAKKKKLGESFVPLLFVKTLDRCDRIEISVRDNGDGIPQDILNKIFNPFFTNKPPGEGTGLGLSLTHDIIVGQHQGNITIETSPGEYAEFVIVLPKN